MAVCVCVRKVHHQQGQLLARIGRDLLFLICQNRWEGRERERERWGEKTRDGCSLMLLIVAAAIPDVPIILKKTRKRARLVVPCHVFSDKLVLLT